MLDLKQLSGQLKAKAAEIDAAYAEVEKAETAGDKAKCDIARGIYDAKQSEFASLEAKVAEARKQEARLAMTREIDAKASVDATAQAVSRSGISGVVRGQGAEAVDHRGREHAHSEAFAKWAAGEQISSAEIELLEPRNAKMLAAIRAQKDDKTGKAVVMPPSLARRCIGARACTPFGLFGKVVMSGADAVDNPSLANYLVPQEFRPVLSMLPFDQPTVLDQVTVLPSVTGNVTLPGLAQTDSNEFGGCSFSWTQETHEKPETEPVFTQIEIPTYELAGYTELGDRAISRSAIPLEPLLVSIFKPALNYALDNAIINGTGSAQPTGLISGGIRTVARAAAGSVSYTDLVNLKHKVKPVHRGGARFALSDGVEAALEGTLDTLNRPLFTPSVANGPFDRLVGYPYDVATNCPAVGTKGDVIYGNFRWYFLVMEEEITVAKSEHYQFRNNVTCFKVFLVVGGRPMQPRAFAMLSDVES